MSGATPEIVSIVIPVYNIEDLVGPCIESVLDQTYEHLEILLVDDGSTDSSGVLVDQFAVQDSRVIALHKPNGGLSDARNYGIDRASGEFILCVDGDDVLAPEHVHGLIAAALDSGADIAVCQFRRVDPIARPPATSRNSVGGTTVLTAAEALERLFYQRGLTTSAWGKLYRRKLFDGIRYPLGEIHEDLPVTYRLIARATRIAVVPEASYLYVQRGGSITSTGQAARRLVALEFAQQAVDYTQAELAQLADAAKCRLFMEAVYITGQARSAAEASTLDARLREVIVANRAGVLADRAAPKVQRLFALFAFGGFTCIRVLFSIMSMASRAKRRLGTA